MSRSKLTPKQLQFVAEFLIDRDATKAAIRAGYSQKTAGQIGYQLLQKPLIRGAVEAGTKKAVERTEIDADWLTHRYRLAYDRAMASKQVSAAVKALDSLGKLKGLIPEKRLVHAGDATQPVAIEVSGNHVNDLPPDGAAAVLRILAEVGAVAARPGPSNNPPHAVADPPPAHG
jgi:hypothetical protein